MTTPEATSIFCWFIESNPNRYFCDYGEDRWTKDANKATKFASKVLAEERMKKLHDEAWEDIKVRCCFVSEHGFLDRTTPDANPAQAEEFQPCPCCGSDDLQWTRTKMGLKELQHVRCMQCGIKVSSIAGFDRWNTRPHFAALGQRINELEGERDTLRSQQAELQRMALPIVQHLRDSWSLNRVVAESINGERITKEQIDNLLAALQPPASESKTK